jgi:hypothetical protein
VFVLGMIVGAGFAHNFALAGKPDNVAEGLVGGISTAGMGAVILGLVVCVAIGFSMREIGWSARCWKGVGSRSFNCADGGGGKGTSPTGECKGETVCFSLFAYFADLCIIYPPWAASMRHCCGTM